jgi:hypothetical protein
MTLVVLTGLVTFIRDGITAARHMAPTPTPTTLILPSTTPIVVQTSTPLPISMPSATLSPAFTLQPTPVYDVIAADPAYGGAVFRAEPGRKGIQLAILNNGTIVQVLPEIENVGTETWVRVRVDTLEGWVLQAVLAPTTLIPTPVPTSTFTPTP